MSEERQEISRLSNYILLEWDGEIGRGNFRTGESAVDVAIRLLKEFKSVRGKEE